MQINDLIQFENIDTLCCCVVLCCVVCCVVTTSMIRQNMYDIKILWLVGLTFELRIGLVFQYTKVQLRSWCTKYICILTTIFTTHVQKRFTFFTVVTTDFCQISQNPILKCKLWTINSFCAQNLSLYWFVVKFL